MVREDLVLVSDDSPGARVFRTSEPVSISYRDGERPDKLAEAEGVQSLCHVPLIGRKRTLGILSLARIARRCRSPITTWSSWG